MRLLYELEVPVYPQEAQEQLGIYKTGDYSLQVRVNVCIPGLASLALQFLIMPWLHLDKCHLLFLMVHLWTLVAALLQEPDQGSYTLLDRPL